MATVTELNRDPNVTVGALEATNSITDPEGNTVTSLSDPVRVTEEASTFAESAVSVEYTDTLLRNGSIEISFGPSTTASRPTDNGTNSNSPSALGLEIIPQTDLGGLEVTLSSNTGNPQDIALVDANENILAEKTGGYTSGDTVRLEASLLSNTKYYVSTYNNGNDYDAGNYSTPNYPYTSTDIDITNGAISFHPDDDSPLVNSNYAYSFVNVTALGDPQLSGNALVSFDSGTPADIDSWDLATFQRTLDGETATVDVEDSTGTVLKSDISKDTDISDIPTTTDVQLRANLSRTNTANNPTVDYLARRFTR